MKNENYSYYEQSKIHSSFLILNSSFFIVLCRWLRNAQSCPRSTCGGRSIYNKDRSRLEQGGSVRVR